MKILIPALLLAAGPALAQEAPQSSAYDRLIASCIDRGTAPAQCECTTGSMQEELSPAELDMLADLMPALDPENIKEAMVLAVATAQEKGFSAEEFASSLEAILASGARSHKICTEAEPSEDGN